MERSLRSDEGRRGAVLIAVMALAALVAAVALEVAYLARIEGDRATDARGRSAATLLAWSGTALALDALAADDGGVDGAGDLWTLPITWTEEVGDVTVTITDESSRLPLQELHDPEGRLNLTVKARLDRLLAALEQPEDLSDLIVDYADANNERFPRGAEVAEYASLRPARRPANRRPWDLAELARVYDLSESRAAILAEHLTLWGDPLVNLNTAPAPVLAALLPAIPLASAERLVSRRTWTRFENTKEAADVIGLSPANLADFQKAAGVGSTTFRITARATAYGRVVTLVSIVERQPAGFAVKYRRLS